MAGALQWQPEALRLALAADSTTASFEVSMILHHLIKVKPFVQSHRGDELQTFLAKASMILDQVSFVKPYRSMFRSDRFLNRGEYDTRCWPGSKGASVNVYQGWCGEGEST